MSDQEKDSTDENMKQITAIGSVYNAVKGLTPDAAFSVLSYVCSMIAPEKILHSKKNEYIPTPLSVTQRAPESEQNGKDDIESDIGIDGITSIAMKWIKRSGLDTNDLSKIFSLGLDEIDIVAKKIPGTSKQQKLKSVFLLKGVAAFLGSGAARFTQEQAKETCEHYDAWDKTNSSTHVKAIGALVGGSASAGYTLTARGLAEAAELIQSMVAADSGKSK